MTCYGWFSEQQVKEGGATAIYLGVDGKEYEISDVTGDSSLLNPIWKDSVCVGEVTRWIRDGRDGIPWRWQ
jgi:hypothetical protein